MADSIPSLSTFDEREFNSCVDPYIILGFCLKVRDATERFEEGRDKMQSCFTPEELGADIEIGLGLVNQATEQAHEWLTRTIAPGTGSMERVTPTQVIRKAAKGTEVLGDVFLAIQQKLDEAGDVCKDDFRGMALMRLALREAADDLGVFAKIGAIDPPLQRICLDLAV